MSKRSRIHSLKEDKSDFKGNSIQKSHFKETLYMLDSITQTQQEL